MVVVAAGDAGLPQPLEGDAVPGVEGLGLGQPPLAVGDVPVGAVGEDAVYIQQKELNML